MKQYSIVLFCLFLICGCGDSRKTETSPAAPAVPTLMLKAVETERVNEFQVVVDWSRVPFEGAITLHRQKINDVKVDDLTAMVEQTTNKFIDTKVEAGETYTYFLGSQNGPKATALTSAKISLSMDLEIAGDVTKLADKKYRRIVFRKGSRLITNGLPLDLQADEIVAEDAEIITFPVDHLPAVGTNGKAGGELRIHAKSAKGKLTINGLGENGGPGADGAPGTTGAPGANGTAGQSKVKLGPPFGDLHRQIAEKLRDKGDIAGVRNLVQCTANPTSGSNGADGTSGADGGNGGAAGDSALVDVKIADRSQLELVVNVEAGIPGRGGFGGSAGLGGAGGKAGSLDGFRACEPAKDGAPGANGTKGKDGTFGARGKRLEPSL